jgi:hypothetical protein
MASMSDVCLEVSPDSIRLEGHFGRLDLPLPRLVISEKAEATFSRKEQVLRIKVPLSK